MDKKYQSYIPKTDGSLPFTESENLIWKRLYERQVKIIPGRACSEYILGLDKLKLSNDKVPFPVDVSRVLSETTGWVAEPVPAVIGPTKFFTLLANKKFPAACFIRSEEDFDYIQEPDIFHEIYGHCPMLTNQYFADFVQDFGIFALTCEKSELKFLFRLFWFTVEFGLIETAEGDRIYGGGILSSIKETQSALNNNQVQYLDFDLLHVFRTPYRIDIPQNLYFKIKTFKQLYESLQYDLKDIIAKASELGDITPEFAIVDGKGDMLEYTN